MTFRTAKWFTPIAIQIASCIALGGCLDARSVETAQTASTATPASQALPDESNSGAAKLIAVEDTQQRAAPNATALPVSMASMPPEVSSTEPASHEPGLNTPDGLRIFTISSTPDANVMTFDAALGIAGTASGSVADHQRALQRASERQRELEASYASDVVMRLVGNSDQSIDETAFRDDDDNRAGEEEVGAELRWTAPWWHKRDFLIDADAAGVDRKIAEIDEENAHLDLGLEVYRRYLTVLLQLARARIASESLSAVETRYHATADSEELGLASPLNALLDETNVSNQRAEVAANVSQLKDGLNSLYHLLGKPYDGTHLCSNYFSFNDYTGEAGDPHDAAMQQARTIALQIDKATVEKGKHEQMWEPRLSASASYAHGFEQSQSDSNDVGSFSLELAIPLPNFEMSRLQRQNSASEISYLQARLARTTAESERRIRDMQAAIITSKEKLRLREEAVNKQRQRIGALRRGLEIGQITRAELEILEDAATSTILAYVDSLHGHLMRIAELNREYGKLPRVPDSCEAVDVLKAAAL